MALIWAVVDAVRALGVSAKDNSLTCIRMEVILSVACLVFPFSLLRPTLLTCSGRSSVTATSHSFLEIFGLSTLFALNYLAN